MERVWPGNVNATVVQCRYFQALSYVPEKVDAVRDVLCELYVLFEEFLSGMGLTDLYSLHLSITLRNATSKWCLHMRSFWNLQKSIAVLTVKLLWYGQRMWERITKGGP